MRLEELQLLVKEHNLAAIRKLIADQDPILKQANNFAIMGGSPLSIALKNGDFEIAELLLNNGANQYEESKERYNLLGLMVKFANKEAIAFLIPKYFDVNELDSMGRTGIWVAVDFGYIGITQDFLKLGADPDIPDFFGVTPLSQARYKSNFIVARELQDFEEKTRTELKSLKDKGERKRGENKQREREIRLERNMRLNRRIKLVKDLGHVEGLSRMIDLEVEGFPPIHTETRATYESVVLLKSIVQDYINQHLDLELKSSAGSTLPLFAKKRLKKQRIFSEVADALQLLENFLSFSVPTSGAANALVKRHKDHKITAMSCSWSGHDVAIYLYKDSLVYCNRGEGRDSAGGTRVYKLKKDEDGKTVVLDALWFLRLRPHGVPLARDRIEAVIAEAVDLDKPICVLPSKGQGHGTCSLANLGAGIEGVCFAVELDERGSNVGAEVYPEVAMNAEVLYKEFTPEKRNIMNHRFAAEIRAAVLARDENEVKFLKNLAIALLLEHPGNPPEPGAKTRQPGKPSHELDRALEILQAFDAVTQVEIIVYLHENGVNLLGNALLYQKDQLVDMLLNPEILTQLGDQYLYNAFDSLYQSSDIVNAIDLLKDHRKDHREALQIVLDNALQNDNIKLIPGLIQAGVQADPRQLDQGLVLAIERRKFWFAEVLLEAGASLDRAEKLLDDREPGVPLEYWDNFKELADAHRKSSKLSR
jgi:ankyrin repeat protein